jgi:hypothetical protein
MRSFCRGLAFLAGLFLFGAAVAMAGNVGPMMIQQYGGDIDNTALFWTNIGGGAVGKLGIGPGCVPVAGALSCQGYVTSGTASAAGSTQGTGTMLSAQQTIVTTTPSGSGVVLANTLLQPQVIYNRGANQLTVYPFSGAQIEAYGTNSPVAIAVGGSAAFRCISTTQCYVGL